jgi:hypothetical protein
MTALRASSESINGPSILISIIVSSSLGNVPERR